MHFCLKERLERTVFVVVVVIITLKVAQPMELELSSEKFTQTLHCLECEQCIVFKNENRIIRNKLIDYKQKL